MSSRLAQRLKSETRHHHQAAERSSLMGDMIRGRVERAPYALLLRNLHALYSTLEPALQRQAGHPVIAPVCLPALWRSPALAGDLRVLHGEGWRDELPLLPAAQAYCQRIEAIEAAAPALLLAHAYVRFLGDLSGGQILRRSVAAALGSPDGERATSFYDFGDAERSAALVRSLRDGIDAAAVDDGLCDALVAEAQSAFERHQRLFDELAALPRATVQNTA